MVDDLPDYFATLIDRKFKYGKFDCFVFVDECLKVVRGYGIPDFCYDDYVGFNGGLKLPSKLKRIYGVNTAEEFMDCRFNRIDRRMLNRGDIVGFRTKRFPNLALGIAWGAYAMVLNINGTGISGIAIGDSDIAWEK